MPLDPTYNLSDRELQVLNFSTQEIDPNVLLGNRFQGALDLILASEVETGTPVNAVAANATLNINGTVEDGEMLAIGDDLYEFCADELQTLTYPGNIAVDIEDDTTKSSGTLTLAVQPTSGDKMTIGTKVYTFVPVGTDTADGEISIGTDLAAAKVNVVAAINGSGFNVAHPLVSAADFVVDDCVITALVGGVDGDAIATTETFAGPTNLFAAGFLSGGADCVAADAVTALVLAITASDSMGVGAADGAGNTVVLTADIAGASANAIPIATTINNAAFANGARKLAGGVDGTVAEGIKFMVDDTWLYVCLSYNEVSGANWRRIALGNVF